MADLTVAKTILAQLGGRRFIAMTGARNICGESNRLMFQLPARFAKSGINIIRITLDWTDTYDVEAMKITKGMKGVKVETIEKRSLVYNEDLQSVFTAMTGLDTHL